ncbi:DUF4082 domain-containing protein [Streptacidiphilus sp. P02-A3a]|nr:DUF4082 domain-containing protein [Streptacidiphilus sp. P02-A3a]
MKFWLFALVATLLVAILPEAGSARAASDPCGSASNAIVCENSQPGTPMSDWFSGNAYGNVEGFSTQESVQAGDTLSLKVQSPIPYHVEIYRLGYYGGDGAREWSTAAQAAVTYPANFTTTGQPGAPLDPGVTDGNANGKALACDTAAATGEVDCGNWPVTATWAVPSDAVSGLYIAELDQTDGNGVMPYPFVVRNDSSTSAVVVQTDDETWQAYNMWGGQDLYQGAGPAPDGRAYAVSYNRPLDIGDDSGANGIFGSEFEMIYWLEENGYDVSYLSGVDVSTRPADLLTHRVFMSSGHDEYWTQNQFTNVLNARKAGVNEAFFSGNEVSWETRFGNSIDGTATADRTLVCYKMTKMELSPPDGVADPSGGWTGAFLDPGSTAYGQAFEPQNILTGSLFSVNGNRNDAMTVPGTYADLRIWRNTSIAKLTPTQTATFPEGTLGYEWDSDYNDSTRPSGEIDLSSTTVDITTGQYVRLDYGNTYGTGDATQSLVEFRDPTSHALVFGTGTVQWSWGLANVPTADPGDAVVTVDPDMQQATVNILADMGVQPLTLQSDLVAATQTTVTVGPTVTVSTPTAGATVPAMQPVTITGTATASTGAVVARVEVSTNGGTSWNPATGLGSWSYSWTPTAPGPVSVEVRAEDDSANVGAVSTVPLTIGPQACPCTVFPASSVPGTVDSGDGNPVSLGVRISSSVPGTVTGIRFYKAATNVGTHTGSLWTSTGQLLATGTFTNETASGWQQLDFATPVPVKANTTYIASYYAPDGHYSYDAGYFSNNGAGTAPLTSPQSSTAAGNGLYSYGTGGVFPSTGTAGVNYWVDAVLTTSTASTVAPAVTGTAPAAAATAASIAAPVTATFSEEIDTSTLAFTLTDAQGNKVPGGAVLGAGDTVTFTPATNLALGTRYTASVQASDLWGNAMTAPSTWSFTTSSTPPPLACPCTLWGSTATPAVPDESGDANSVELGTRFESAVAGQVTGVTFYKGTGNTGTHTGSLWSGSGALLASGTFTKETASGWQTLTFATPVAITANTPYVVSYHAPDGNYAYSGGFFAGPVQQYPLTGTADGSGTANGVYAYGTTSSFPTGTSGSANYWVGPVFTATTASGSSPAGAQPSPKPSSTSTSAMSVNTDD